MIVVCFCCVALFSVHASVFCLCASSSSSSSSSVEKAPAAAATQTERASETTTSTNLNRNHQQSTKLNTIYKIHASNIQERVCSGKERLRQLRRRRKGLRGDLEIDNNLQKS